MKFVAILALLLSAVDASGRLRGVEPITGTSVSNNEIISSNQNDVKYSRSVVVSGSLTANDFCMDMDRFCFDGAPTTGNSRLFVCMAIQNARSHVRANWSYGATLSVDIDDADVNKIRFVTRGTSAAVAIAFSRSTTNIQARAATANVVRSEAAVGEAVATAVASGMGTAVSLTEATSFGNAVAGTTSRTRTLVSVVGTQLQYFKGSVHMLASHFVSSTSTSTSSALAIAASSAFSRSVANACFQILGRSCNRDVDEDFDNALLRADEFGRAFATAVSKVSIIVAIQASIIDAGNTLKLSLGEDNNIAATAAFGCSNK